MTQAAPSAEDITAKQRRVAAAKYLNYALDGLRAAEQHIRAVNSTDAHSVGNEVSRMGVQVLGLLRRLR